MHRGERVVPAGTSGHNRPTTAWYVYDRLFNYRIIYEVEHASRRKVPSEIMARLRARKLNKEYERWLRERGLL
jgi:hypothetical protein